MKNVHVLNGRSNKILLRLMVAPHKVTLLANVCFGVPSRHAEVVLVVNDVELLRL